MITNVFFDFDGVLGLEGHACVEISKQISNKFDLDQDLFAKTFHKYAKEILRNPLKYGSFIDSLNTEMKSNISVSDILDAITSTTPNQKMLELAKDLRDLGVKTGIITDNNIERAEVLGKVFNFSDYSPVIVSAYYGVGKADSDKLFKLALDQANVNAKQAVFIDNRKPSLTQAKNIGINVYYHDDQKNDIDKFRNYLKNLGIKI